MQAVARYGTRDLATARRFYDAIADLLGAARVMDRDDLVAYRGSDGGMLLIGKPFAGEATVGNGSQIGFNAPDRRSVDAVHAKALELGGTDEGAPGLRGPEEQGFYGAYFRDPDGNKLAVFHMGAG